ncbi:MAG: basic amino acid ABC transporter substrate-binding protein [Actinobacteria bacterium]|nr:basic amino acid ABC transporter substrate-binding protein [Actinomycetota bacterium]
MKRKLLIILLVIIVSISSILISCAKKTETTTQDTAVANQAQKIDMSNVKTLKSGVLTVGSDCTWQPMEYMEGDKIIGFDVDLAKAIAGKLGLKLDYQNTAWDGMFPAVAAHKFDMIISSITIYDERKEEMDFSYPYLPVNQAITVKKDSGIDSLEKMNGKKAGVQIGTTGEIEAKKITGVTVSTYDDIIMAFEDLRAGRVDAIICDTPVADAYVLKNADFQVGYIILTNEFYGIGFAKDTPELVKAVDEALKAIKDDGTYDKIFANWFGEEALKAIKDDGTYDKIFATWSSQG